MRRTLQSFLFSRLNDPNSVTLSSQKRYSSSPIICMATLWTCSNRSMYFLCWGPQYSSWGHMKVGRITSLNLLATLLFMQTRIQLVFLGCKYTLSVHIHFFRKSFSAGLLSTNSSFAFISGIAPVQMQDLTLGLILHEVHVASS